MVPLRILSLATALSKYQILTHPRGAYCYSPDTHDPSQILSFLEAVNFELSPNVRKSTLQMQQDINTHITAVVGDTLLSSISWVQGLKLSGMDLYDSCLVALTIDNIPYLVPVARALSGPPKPVGRKDVETMTEPNFAAKGGSNDGVNISWVFWIPVDDDCWLHFISDMDITGPKTATLLDDGEVTRRLALEDLWISLKNVDEVKQVVKHSARVGEVLCRVVAP